LLSLINWKIYTHECSIFCASNLHDTFISLDTFTPQGRGRKHFIRWKGRKGQVWVTLILTLKLHVQYIMYPVASHVIALISKYRVTIRYIDTNEFNSAALEMDLRHMACRMVHGCTIRQVATRFYAKNFIRYLIKF